MSIPEEQKGATTDKERFPSSTDRIRCYVRLQVGLCIFLWFASFLAYMGVEWLRTRRQPRYVTVSPRPPLAIITILRASGAVSVVVGNIGWWGALHQRHGVICVFSAFTWLSSVLEISCGSVTLSYAGKMPLVMREDIVRNLKLVRDPTANELTENFLELQQKLKCCGVHSYHDWVESPWWKSQREINSSSVIPSSCCVYSKSTQNCSIGEEPYTEVHYPGLVHDVGCLKKLSEFMDFLFQVTGCSAFVCGVIKFCGFILVNILGNNILILKHGIEKVELEYKACKPTNDLNES